MALIKCPDCQTELSDQAPSCPKCARPMVRVQALAKLAAKQQRSSSSTLGIGVGFIVGFALVWAGCGMAQNGISAQGFVFCAMGGALFAILGGILGAFLG